MDEAVTDDERAARRAFRDFVRIHHPDRGGDPTTFVAGLARYRAAEAVAAQWSRAAGGHGAAPAHRPTLYKRRSLTHQVWSNVLAAMRSAVMPRSPRVR